MKTDDKLYIAPDITVTDIRPEGIICQSGDLSAPDFGDGGEIFLTI